MARILSLFLMLIIWQATGEVSGQVLEQMEKEFIRIADKAKKSCVKIEVVIKTTVHIKNKVNIKNGKPADKFEIKEREDKVFRSGVVIDKDNGYIVTLGESLIGAKRVSVGFFNGLNIQRSKAKILGINLQSNIGLLKVNTPIDAEIMPIGDSSKIKTGALVMGLGFSYNLEPSPSFSMGIVSATDRVLQFRFHKGGKGMKAKPDQSKRITRFIQASIPIQPGETGGPLLNTSSEIVGLLIGPYSASVSPSGPFLQGCAMVMPINHVKKEVEWILAQQKEKLNVSVEKKVNSGPWIGLTAGDITDEALRTQLGLNQGGVLVQYVFPGDPANQAGIIANDVLSVWDDTPVKGVDHLKKLINLTKIGDKVKIKVIRKGKEKLLEIHLGKY